MPSDIIDFHVHVGKSSDTAVTSVPKILREMDRLGISKSVIFPLNEENPGPSYSRLNQIVLRASKKHKCLIRCARINPNQRRAAFDQIKFAGKHGFRILKFHPRADGYGPERAETLFDEINRHRYVVVVHSDHEIGSSARGWAPLFKRYSKCTFVLTHGGKDWWRDVIDVAGSLKNVFVDTSTLSYYRTGMLLKGLGERKIVFGSDTPYSHPELEIRKFDLLLSKRALRWVFHDNARHILGL